MILEVQRYRSFHAKSGAILRFILALKIFHKVIVTAVYLQDTVQIRILAKHPGVLASCLTANHLQAGADDVQVAGRSGAALPG